jgi:hypothetical protein
MATTAKVEEEENEKEERRPYRDLEVAGMAWKRFLLQDPKHDETWTGINYMDVVDCASKDPFQIAQAELLVSETQLMIHWEEGEKASQILMRLIMAEARMAEERLMEVFDAHSYFSAMVEEYDVRLEEPFEEEPYEYSQDGLLEQIFEIGQKFIELAEEYGIGIEIIGFNPDAVDEPEEAEEEPADEPEEAEEEPADEPEEAEEESADEPEEAEEEPADEPEEAEEEPERRFAPKVEIPARVDRWIEDINEELDPMPEVNADYGIVNWRAARVFHEHIGPLAHMVSEVKPEGFDEALVKAVNGLHEAGLLTSSRFVFDMLMLSFNINFPQAEEIMDLVEPVL